MISQARASKYTDVYLASTSTVVRIDLVGSVCVRGELCAETPLDNHPFTLALAFASRLTFPSSLSASLRDCPGLRKTVYCATPREQLEIPLWSEDFTERSHHRRSCTISLLVERNLVSIANVKETPTTWLAPIVDVSTFLDDVPRLSSRKNCHSFVSPLLRFFLLRDYSRYHRSFLKVSKISSTPSVDIFVRLPCSRKNIGCTIKSSVLYLGERFPFR